MDDITSRFHKRQAQTILDGFHIWEAHDGTWSVSNIERIYGTGRHGFDTEEEAIDWVRQNFDIDE